ncbi:MAG: ROK family protein, partial [Phycisphaeraceae bacterium]|nr:ROK family protein [Phycisphaeraceae bacterium]
SGRGFGPPHEEAIQPLLQESLTKKTQAGREVCLRIGIDMGGSDIKFGATTLDAQQILTPDLVKRPSLTADGPQKTIGQMLDGIEAILKQIDCDWSDLADIAVTVPCPCSAEGVILEATNLGTPKTKNQWRLPFADHLARAVAEASGETIPVFACNDANAAGQDDDFVRFGHSSEPRTSVFITTGTGLGGCVLFNGNVYFGGGQAGELGHIKPAIPAAYRDRFETDYGRRCGCGSEDCVESIASLQGLMRRMPWALGEPGAAFIAKDLARRGEKTDPQTLQKLRELQSESDRRAAYEVRSFADRDRDAFCRWLLEDWAIMIGTLFANVAPVLHPDLFIIGGGLTEMSDEARDWFIGIVRRVYGEVNSQKSFTSSDQQCRIAWSVSTDQGWRGAILMAMRHQSHGAGT